MGASPLASPPLLAAGAVLGLAGLLAAAASTPGASAAPPGGTFEWQTATPESQGMATAKLDALKDGLAAQKTKSFLVVRNDRVVYEWYAPGHSAATKHYTASLAKAVVAGVSMGVALSDGRVALDDPAAKYIPQWRTDPRKSRITLRQLGSHTSGIEDAEAGDLPHAQLTGWKGDFWKPMDPPRDSFTVSRDQAPVIFDPGTRMQYSNPGIALLTYAVTAALRDAPEKDVRAVLREGVMRPIGVADADWSCGYGRTVTVDGLRLVGSWGGGSYTARALARVGRLMLRQGDWEGRQLLSREAVRQITGDAGLPGHLGMGWWTNAGGRYPKLPRDAFWGAGAGDQILLVVPSLNLIAVRNGDALQGTADRQQEPRARLLFDPLVDAVTDRGQPASAAPYPPSPVIRGITWAPAATILRKAKESDNWPTTWGDDDFLYTAYGDGRGFEPFLPKKVSLGVARVSGTADRFAGENLRAASVEREGDGPKGPKASGMLMVEGVLYMWTRNTANSQLVWSADHGKSWTWADWKFTDRMGCPTFLNFGKNHAGARDDYVYLYSHDGDSAYVPADRMVLARVPKGKIRERAAYEFFQGTNSGGQPRWTADFARREAVFTYPGRCLRSLITYNPGLRRYLWVQQLPRDPAAGDRADLRRQGGFGIYDAPEPWGPWTTVYLTEKWDVGPGESAGFPSKWISPDGRELALLFSGDDSFSVRKATLEVVE